MKKIVIVKDIKGLGLNQGMILTSEDGDVFNYISHEREVSENGEKESYETRSYSKDSLQEYIDKEYAVEYGSLSQQEPDEEEDEIQKGIDPYDKEDNNISEGSPIIIKMVDPFWYDYYVPRSLFSRYWF